MKPKVFLILSSIILIAGFLLRIIPLQNNNFYFTVDQGWDSVYAREIFERGQLLLKGPATNIEGIHAQPGWFYFLALGYKLTGGHPIGPILLLIILNLGIMALLMWQIKKRVSPLIGLFVGFALQIFWPFYDTSRWAFNPFLLVFLSIIVILLLVHFLEGKRWCFYAALLPIVLAFHAEVAGAGALTVFYTAFALWAIITKKISLKSALLLTTIAILALAPTIIEIITTFIRTRFGNQPIPASIGTFSGTNFIEIAQEFVAIIKNSIIPQSLVFSFAVFILSLILFFKQQKNFFISRFTYLTLALFLLSYLWFSTNKGWRDWHTVYLPPLLFTMLILIIASLNRYVSYLLLSLILLSQSVVFIQRYQQYLTFSPDPGILRNQIAVLDWIYNNNKDDGFTAYTYSPTGYDFPYQYLFWWYGKNKYGFLPCEYATHPHKLEMKKYVPNSLAYTEPKLGCNRYRFLIIEPPTDQLIFNKWFNKYHLDTTLLETTQIGKIIVEKRSMQNSN